MTTRVVPRRRLLRATLALAGASLVAGCGGQALLAPVLNLRTANTLGVTFPPVRACAGDGLRRMMRSRRRRFLGGGLGGAGRAAMSGCGTPLRPSSADRIG